MMIRLNNLIRRFRRDDEGVTLVEYGIGVALAVVVGTFMLGQLGGGINGSLDAARDCMQATAASAAADCVNSGAVD